MAKQTINIGTSPNDASGDKLRNAFIKTNQNFDEVYRYIQDLEADSITQSELDTALSFKVDKVTGKGLSSEDFTTSEKNKLAQQSGTNTGDQDLSGLQLKSEKGQANGYASLGDDGKVHASQLPVDNSVKRGFSFNEGAVLAADYYPSNTSITSITARNITKVEYGTDGLNFTELVLPGGLPLAVAAGDLYWRITYTNGKTQAFLDITGTK